MGIRLPVLQSSLDRRQLLLLSASVSVAACGPNPNFGLIDEALPPSTDVEEVDASEPALDVGVPVQDAGAVPVDVGVMPRDTGVVVARDSGPILRDSGPATPPDVGSTCTPRGTMVGTVASLPVGAYRVMGRTSTTVIVGHDGGGFYAFVGVCPHQGCALGAPVSGTITCSCHRARFDANGALLAGPARTSLPHREVTVCDGVVYLGTATVAASARTPA